MSHLLSALFCQGTLDIRPYGFSISYYLFWRSGKVREDTPGICPHGFSTSYHFLQRSAIVAGSADELGVLKLINRTKACQSERKGKKMQKQEVGGMVKKKDGEKQNSLSGVYWAQPAPWKDIGPVAYSHISHCSTVGSSQGPDIIDCIWLPKSHRCQFLSESRFSDPEGPLYFPSFVAYHMWLHCADSKWISINWNQHQREIIYDNRLAVKLLPWIQSWN